MKVSGLISKLENLLKKEGDIRLRNVSYETPWYIEKWHLNGKKDKSKPMPRKEYQRLHDTGAFTE